MGLIFSQNTENGVLTHIFLYMICCGRAEEDPFKVCDACEKDYIYIHNNSFSYHHSLEYKLFPRFCQQCSLLESIKMYSLSLSYLNVKFMKRDITQLREIIFSYIFKKKELINLMLNFKNLRKTYLLPPNLLSSPFGRDV